MLFGMRQSVMRDQGRDVGQFGGLRLQEFLAGGNVEEKIAHRDGSSERKSGFFDAGNFAAVDLDDRAGRFFRGASFEAEARHRRDRGQGLSPKSQSGDA